MAYTKIHAIKATLPKAVKYILNPAKTDGQILVSTFGCGVKTIPYDFTCALSKTKQSDENKAFHLIQAFAPGEVSYEEAHKVGQELADRLLEGKYSYVIATHIDRGHIHNHIIFCAADNIEHHKYNDCKRSYHHIRELSDELCKEHELSVIIPSGKRGMKYNEWLAQKNGTSWKQKLRDDIDEAIANSTTYEGCIEMIRAKGYEIEGESLASDAHKYITFRPYDRERCVRGSVKSLGADYTKERISERIDELNAERSKDKVPISTKKSIPLMRRKPLIKDYSKRQLIDTTQEKFADSPGLQHWAAVENLKIAASSYAEAESMQDLFDKIAEKQQIAKTARATVVEIEHQMREMGEILKYASDYFAYRKINFHYQKSKDPDAYFRNHESELILYEGAVNFLKQNGINPKSLDFEKLKADYQALEAKKSKMQKTYKSAEKEAAELSQKLAKVQQYIGQQKNQEPEQTPPQQQKKPNQSL